MMMKMQQLNLMVKHFANTITLIRNYWHNGLTEAENSGQYPEAFMMISALQQFPVQGVFLQKLSRYHYLFTFQNRMGHYFIRWRFGEIYGTMWTDCRK